MTIYHPFEQEIGGGRLFIHAKSDPYALVPAVTSIVRKMSNDQPVERATLDDVRRSAPPGTVEYDRIWRVRGRCSCDLRHWSCRRTCVFGPVRTPREFGIRLAIGSQPGRLLTGVLWKDSLWRLVVISGALGGVVLYRIIGSYVEQIPVSGAIPIVASALVLLLAASTAALLPARAARVDVVQALRTE